MNDALKDFMRKYKYQNYSPYQTVISPEERLVYVFARDYRTATLYADKAGISRKLVRYIESANSLRGRADIEIHVVTTHTDHARYHKIKEYIDVLVQSGRATVKEVEW